MADHRPSSLYQFVTKKVKETVIAAVYPQTKCSKENKDYDTLLLENQKLADENTKLTKELEAAKLQNDLITKTGQRIIHQRETTVVSQIKQITNLEKKHTDQLKHIEELKLDLKVINERNQKQVQELTELLDDRVAEAAVNLRNNSIERKVNEQSNNTKVSTEQQTSVQVDEKLEAENLELKNKIERLTEELADAKAKILIQEGNRLGQLYHAYVRQKMKLEDAQKLIQQYEHAVPTIKTLLGKAFQGCLRDVVNSSTWLTDIILIVRDNGIESFNCMMDVGLLRQQNKKLNDQFRKMYHAYMTKKTEVETLKSQIMSLEESNKRQQQKLSEKKISTMPRQETRNLKRKQLSEKATESVKTAKTVAYSSSYDKVQNKQSDGPICEARHTQKV